MTKRNTPPEIRRHDPEVQPASIRATWTAPEKLALLTEYETFPRGSAERGAFLRRHGLYTSHMSKWRDLRDRGALAGLAPQPRGPKPLAQDPLIVENVRLQQELARVQARLTQAEAVIDIQKNWHSCLGRCRIRRRRTSADGCQCD